MADEADITQAGEQGDSGRLYSGRVVAFFLNEQRYAVPIDRVQEIQQIVAFSEVPGAGSGVVGMVNLRGRVIPAVDLRRMLGMPPLEYTLDTPMIICHIGDHFVAVVVDEVQDVTDFGEDRMQEPPPMHALSSKMLGVARMDDGLTYVLDLDALLGNVLVSGGW